MNFDNLKYTALRGYNRLMNRNLTSVVMVGAGLAGGALGVAGTMAEGGGILWGITGASVGGAALGGFAAMPCETLGPILAMNKAQQKLAKKLNIEEDLMEYAADRDLSALGDDGLKTCKALAASLEAGGIHVSPGDMATILKYTARGGDEFGYVNKDGIENPCFLPSEENFAMALMKDDSQYLDMMRKGLFKNPDLAFITKDPEKYFNWERSYVKNIVDGMEVAPGVIEGPDDDDYDYECIDLKMPSGLVIQTESPAIALKAGNLNREALWGSYEKGLEGARHTYLPSSADDVARARTHHRRKMEQEVGVDPRKSDVTVTPDLAEMNL